jgi:hypothetical protein
MGTVFHRTPPSASDGAAAEADLVTAGRSSTGSNPNRVAGVVVWLQLPSGLLSCSPLHRTPTRTPLGRLVLCEPLPEASNERL